MPLRMMQIFLPPERNRSPEDLLEDCEVLGQWRDDDSEPHVLHLLVTAEAAEPIMDEFEQHYGELEGFRLVLFPVEATLPRAEPTAEAAAETDNETEQNERPPEAPRISREELYTEVSESIELTRVFFGMTLLSAVVAAVGLLRDDVAVIIGAMVIAPLLGPNVAMSLGTTLGDTDLIRRSLITNVAGVVTALALAIVIGMLFPVDPEIPAIASRTQLNVGDLLLALAAGAAGTLAFTRGLATAVIGVMVAVALVPPLVVAGLLCGAGDLQQAFGAMLLTSANVICINLAGTVTFLIQGVRPRHWWDAERARAATWRAVALWTVLLAALLLILWLVDVGIFPIAGIPSPNGS